MPAGCGREPLLGQRGVQLPGQAAWGRGLGRGRALIRHDHSIHLVIEAADVAARMLRLVEGELDEADPAAWLPGKPARLVAVRSGPPAEPRIRTYGRARA